MSRREAIFFLAGGNNPERALRQRFLKRRCFLHRKCQPRLYGFLGCENDGHGLGTDCAHFHIGVRGEKPEQLMLALNRISSQPP
jgi:hypothetical protein